MSTGDWVVIEFNQASHMPRVATNEVFDNLEEASTEAEHLQNATNQIGRGERFTVARLSYRDENY